MTTAPSAATRSDFFSALARPLLRSCSTAASMSPSVATSAFLHSIMPAPVRSRSSLTCDAEILIALSKLLANRVRSGLAAFVISLDCRLLDCFLLGGLLLAHRFGGFGLAFARAFILGFYGLVLGVNCLVTGFGGFLVLGFSRLIRGFGSFLVLGFSSLGLGF